MKVDRNSSSSSSKSSSKSESSSRTGSSSKQESSKQESSSRTQTTEKSRPQQSTSAAPSSNTVSSEKNTLAAQSPALRAQSGRSSFETAKAQAVVLNPSSTPTVRAGGAGITSASSPLSASAGANASVRAQTGAPDTGLERVGNALRDFANHSVTLDGQLRQGDVAGAVNTALNSPGDSITLHIAADGSIGAGGNVGINGSTEVTITLNEDGKYEVSLAGEAGVTAGAELAEGTEANVGISGSVSPTFTFDSPAEVAQGMAALAGLAAQSAPGTSVLTTVVDQVAGPVAGVSNWLGDQLQGASDLPVVGGLANAVGGFFNGVGDTAQAVDNATGIEAAQFLQQHLTSVTVSGSAAVDVAANLGIPGLELENFGVNAEVAASGEMALTLEFTQPPKVSIDHTFSLEPSASAGLGLGASGEGRASVSFHNEYTFNQNFDLGQVLSGQRVQAPFSVGEATVAFEIEAQGQGSAGLGLSANMGMGGKISFEVNQADVLNGLGSAAVNSFAQGNLGPLLTHLGNVPITVESELYGTASLEAGVGVSIGGNGASVEGELAWQDVLLTNGPTTFTGSQILNSVQGGVASAAELFRKYGPYLVN